MTEVEYSRASEATALCKACGLCCTGHLFSWVRLNAKELTPLEKLGLNVIRSDPRQRGFTQPCPMWNGECSIYNSPHYPRGCDSYKCKLLRELLDESVSLPKALKVVKRAKDRIREVEALLPASSENSFRERLVEYWEGVDGSKGSENTDLELEQKAHALLLLYKDDFGVKDLVENLEEV
jgi:hypothetical protein